MPESAAVPPDAPSPRRDSSQGGVVAAVLGATTRKVGVALRDIVVVILMLAATFDGLSGNWVHAILLYATAVALGRDAVRRHSVALQSAESTVSAPGSTVAYDDPRSQARRLVMVPAALVAVLAYAVIVGGFARYSWPTTVAIVIPGAVVLALSWNGPLRPRAIPPPVGTLGAAAWISVFVCLGLWEFTQLLLQPNLTTDSWAHPTLSVLTDPILASHPGRTVGLVVWLLFGWFLLDR